MSARAHYTFDNPANGCPRCGRDFSSLAAFDRHHLNMDSPHYWSPEHPDGFRCMDDAEIAEAFELDDRGRYRLPLTEKKREQLAALRQK